MNIRIALPIIVALTSLMGQSASFAQVYEDVVYLKDGGVRRGMIIEQTPGVSVKLKTIYGEIFVIEMSEISRMAKEENATPAAKNDRATRGSSGVKLESWYTYWGAGTSRITWPGELNDVMDLLASMPGVSRTRLILDMLGFYKPVHTNTIVGFVVNGAADRIDVDAEAMQINLFTYAASAQYFPAGVGKGFFGRVDIGPAIGSIQISGEEDENSEAGFGFLAGAGYAHPITPGTRLMLNLNYATRKIEGDTWNTVGISLG